MRGEEPGSSDWSQGQSGGAYLTANLVIRVWGEPSNPDFFRARIIESTSEGGENTVGYASNRKEVVAAVSRWLDRLPDIWD